MIVDGRKIEYWENPEKNNWSLQFGPNEEHAGEISTITIDLGNLGLHNACSYYVPKDPKAYPMAWFQKKTKQDYTRFCDSDKPEDCPKGFEIYQQYDTPFEALLDYARWLQEEYKNLADGTLAQKPYGHFTGQKRNARWHNECQRRKLID